MKKLFIIAFIALFVNLGVTKAQESVVSVDWTIGFGMGDLGDYVEKASFRGFAFTYKWNFSNENLYAGLDLGWNAFYEDKDYDTYTYGTISVSGKQFRYTNHYPILVSVDYFFLPGEDFNPYVNFGLGTMYTLRRTDMGIFRVEQEAWHFAIKPEAGIIYNFNYSTGFKVGVKYLTGFKSGDLETQSYLMLDFGIAWWF